MSDTSQKVRLDRWLWAARFYKTRALAVDAIKRGHVTLSELKVKPARMVSVNDELRIRKAQLVFNITICSLSQKRLGAELAKDLYAESSDSIESREQRKQEVKAVRQTLINGRPSKKDRRLQQAVKRQYR